MEPFLPAVINSQTKSPRSQAQKRREQKARVLYSCTVCRRNKLKCDRRNPCANCVKRKQETSCHYNIERSTGTSPQGASGLQNRLNFLEQRLRDLENTTSKKSRALSIPQDVIPTDDERRCAASSNRSNHIDPAAAPRLNPGLLQSGDNGLLYINTNHWRAIMSNAERELSRDNSDTADRTAYKKIELNHHSPALLIGLSQGLGFVGHLESLPSQQVADALVLRCLDSEEASMISMHAPTFKSEYRDFWKNPAKYSPAWLSLLYGILSCAVWMEHTSNPATADLELPDIFHVYRIQSAAFLVKSDITTPGKYKVEAAIIYLETEFLRIDNLKTGISMLLGLISRLAIMAGFHRDPQMYTGVTTFEAEMRRRAWLLLLVTDCVVAVESGLPRVIARGLRHTIHPRNLLDEDFGPSTEFLPPPRADSDTCSRITFMLAHESMLSIATEIADTDPSFACVPERIIHLNKELEAVKRRVPAFLRLPPFQRPVADEKTTLWRYNLEMTYQRGRCILHRPYLVNHTSEYQNQSFREICVAAARRILELQQEIFQDFLSKAQNRHRTWFGASRSISDGLTAAMVLSLELIYRKKANQPLNNVSSDQLAQLLKSSYMSWKYAPRRSLETVRAAEIVTMMLDRMGVCDLSQCTDKAQYLTPEDHSKHIDVIPQRHVLTDDVEGFTSSQRNLFDDLLSGDPTQDMFDWALWDREMQLLMTSTKAIE